MEHKVFLLPHSLDQQNPMENFFILKLIAVTTLRFFRITFGSKLIAKPRRKLPVYAVCLCNCEQTNWILLFTASCTFWFRTRMSFHRSMFRSGLWLRCWCISSLWILSRHAERNQSVDSVWNGLEEILLSHCRHRHFTIKGCNWSFK